MTSRFKFINLILLLIILGTHAFGQTMKLKITSRLGTESEFIVKSTFMDEEVVNSSIKNQILIPLELNPSTNIFIPVWNIKTADFFNDSLHITLLTGETYTGRGVGSLIDKADNKIGVNSILHLSVLEIDNVSNKNLNDEKTSNSKWKLTMGFSKMNNILVTQPIFLFAYYTNTGYVMGGVTKSSETRNFYIKLGNDEIETSIDTYKSIRIEYKWPANSSNITVITPNGVSNTGELSLKYKGDPGSDKSFNWFLKTLMNNGTVLIVKNYGPPNKEIILERID